MQRRNVINIAKTDKSVDVDWPIINLPILPHTW